MEKTNTVLFDRRVAPTVFLAAALTAAACATSPPPPAPPSSPIAAENVDDIKENLRSFDKDVKAFVASANDRSSVNDPNSFRAHELAGERNLSARAANLRRRIHAAFGTIPPMQRPGPDVPPAASPPPSVQASPSSAPSAPAPPEQQALIDQLDASVKDLQQAPPPPAAP